MLVAGGFSFWGDFGGICSRKRAAVLALACTKIGTRDFPQHSTKNWLFAGFEQDGVGAEIMSLVVTAKANSINPDAWLRKTLTRQLATLDRDIDTLLPLRRN